MPSKNTYPPKVNISKTIKNLSELRSIINVIADKFGQYLSEIAKDYMQQYIEEEVYTNNVLASGTDGEDYYERTYEFGLAWKQEKSRIIGRQIGGEISFDPSALVVNESMYQHTQAEKLAKLIYNGYAPTWDNATQNIPPRDYWSPFITEVNTNIKGWIKDAYLRRGIRLI